MVEEKYNIVDGYREKLSDFERDIHYTIIKWAGKNTKYGKFIKTAASTRHMRKDITDEYWKWYFEGT